MSKPEDIALFQGVATNFDTEYHEARKLMGLKTTRLEELYYNVGLMYVNAPEKWQEAYYNLMTEIDMRMEMISRLK